jgi:rhodanese-related sulfurtransferase
MNARLPLSALAFLAFLALPVAASSQMVGDRVEVPGGAYWNVTPSELQQMLASDDKPLLVNTHIPFAGDIAGTDVSIPFNEITDHLDELPQDKDAPVVLYCRSGPMSVRAAAALVGVGFTHVYSLEGGFNAWNAAGLPMEGR